MAPHITAFASHVLLPHPTARIETNFAACPRCPLRFRVPNAPLNQAVTPRQFPRSQQNNPSTAATPFANDEALHPEILIAGGGPCGALAAAALSNRGYTVTLIETSSDPIAETRVSSTYSISLRGRGTEVLEDVPGLRAALQRHSVAVPNLKFTFVNDKGQARTRITTNQTDEDNFGGDRPSLVALRPRILLAFQQYFTSERNAAMRARYGARVDSVEYDGAGTLRVVVKDINTGAEDTICPRLLLACDGRNSAVLSSLRNAPPGTVWTPRGLAAVELRNRVVGLRSRTLVVRPELLANLSGLPGDWRSTCSVILRGAAKSQQRLFSLSLFPIRDDDAARYGGLLALVSRPPSNALWQFEESDVNGFYALLEENFPYLDVRAGIAEVEVRRFLQSGGTTYPSITRPASLVATIGASNDLEDGGDSQENSAVVILGDAAHCFPPVQAQGANAAFEDISVLLKTMEETGCRPGNIKACRLAKEYHARRDGDVSALITIAQRTGLNTFSDPGRELLGLFANFGLRAALSKLAPSLFSPAVQFLVSDGVPYSEAWYRAEATTRRLQILAIVLLALVVGILSVWLRV